MWISRREITRLERELKAALQRAKSAEDDLRVERQSKDFMIAQLTSRFVTRNGGYGLETEKPVPPAPHPKGYTHEPSEMDLAKLEYYKLCARNAGVDEQDAVLKWEAEMRGETLSYEYQEGEAIG